MRGLPEYEGAPVARVRGAARRAFSELATMAIEEAVDFLVIAGDLYDGSWPDYSTGLYFTEQMTRLREVGIPAFIARGNHDAESRLTKALRLPDNVTIFPTGKAGTFEVDGLDVVLHGRSFERPIETDNVVLDFPRPALGALNIGVLHTSAAGSPGHATYAPCTVADLQTRGYDYWALGHIHKREALSESPYVVFPGNLQGRHIRETGPKGFTMVTVDSGRITVEVRDIGLVRWEAVPVSADGCATDDDVLTRVEAALTAALADTPAEVLATRVTVRGASPGAERCLARIEHFTRQVQAVGVDVGRERLIVEKVIVDTGPGPVRDASKSVPDEAALSLLQYLTSSDEDLARLAEDAELWTLFSRLESAWDGDAEYPSLSQEALHALLPRAQALLRAELAGEGGADEV